MATTPLRPPRPPRARPPAAGRLLFVGGDRILLEAFQGAAEEQDTPNGQPEKPASSKKGGSGKARKSQVDLLKTLAVEWRGENGVERLENRVGKPLTDMTRAEADEWIDRLTPEGRE